MTDVCNQKVFVQKKSEGYARVCYFDLLLHNGKITGVVAAYAPPRLSPQRRASLSRMNRGVSLLNLIKFLKYFYSFNLQQPHHN